ncbi:MAG TPA: phosphoenolpyruvate--protein phosphotransferase [Polyangia bacterium]
MLRLSGTAAGSGIAVGPVRLPAARILVEERRVAPERRTAEISRLDSAVASADAAMAEVGRQVTAPAAVGSDIVDVHRAILQSDELVEGARRLIRERGIGAEWAIRRVVDQLGLGFAQMQDERFRERFADVEQVAERLLRRLLGLPAIREDESVAGAIVVGFDLSPVDAMQLHGLGVAGFATERGGPTSHAAIVCRALGLPFVFGVHGLVEAVRAGDTLCVDANFSEVVVRPDDATLRSFAERRAAEVERMRLVAATRQSPAVTLDGAVVSLGANIESATEVAAALEAGADHIGLVRTELLYLARSALPSEEEQYCDAVDILRAAAGRPVTFRTLDLGGDKLPAGVRISVGPNPALGVRGIRFSLDRQDIFRTQLRALYRAAAVGPLRIMLPLVSRVIEMREARRICDRVCEELARERIDHDPRAPLGAMIETPSAVFTADHIVAESDFISVGTNDLIQYAFAADRQNESMAYLYQPMDPAVLRALAQVFAAAAAGRPVSVCGDMAGDPWNTWLLVGLGLRSFSMAMPELAFVKSVIRKTEVPLAEELARAALALTSAEEVAALASARFGARLALELDGRPRHRKR